MENKKLLVVAPSPHFRDKITSAFCAIFQVAMATEGDYYEPLDRYSIPRR